MKDKGYFKVYHESNRVAKQRRRRKWYDYFDFSSCSEDSYELSDDSLAQSDPECIQ
jgi:hypothetical protein